jgi:outer membrane murein-binding lipoprotein Lpp
MKTEHWLAIVVVAALVGVLIGYGVWGSGSSEVAELKGKVDQLTRENEQFRAAQAPAPPAMPPASGETAQTSPAGSTISATPASAPAR